MLVRFVLQVSLSMVGADIRIRIVVVVIRIRQNETGGLTAHIAHNLYYFLAFAPFGAFARVIFLESTSKLHKHLLFDYQS